MSSTFGHNPDSLPLLIVSGGKKQARKETLAALLSYSDGKSLAALHISRLAEEGETFAVRPQHVCRYIAGKGFLQDFQKEDKRRTLVGLARRLAADHDLVVAEMADGGSDVRIELFRCSDEPEGPVFDILPGDGGRRTLEKIEEWLAEKVLQTPVWGCLLIGGGSTRMGRPKHLLRDGTGTTWAEMLVGELKRVTGKVVLAGKGDIPKSIAGLTRLADIDEARGPVAGLLAAMRWAPHVSWVVCACDMPFVKERGLTWLLDQRRPGVWGVVPYQGDIGRYHPLLGFYDLRAKQLFEKMVAENSMRIGGVVAHRRILTPALPAYLQKEWRNCNSPADLDGLI